MFSLQDASGFNLSSSDLIWLAEVTAIDRLNSIVQRMLDQVAAGQSNNSNQADAENLRQFNEQLRSEEHTSELQSLMRISYAVFCLKKKNNNNNTQKHTNYIITHRYPLTT